MGGKKKNDPKNSKKTKSKKVVAPPAKPPTKSGAKVPKKILKNSPLKKSPTKSDSKKKVSFKDDRATSSTDTGKNKPSQNAALLVPSSKSGAKSSKLNVDSAKNSTLTTGAKSTNKSSNNSKNNNAVALGNVSNDGGDASEVISLDSDSENNDDNLLQEAENLLQGAEEEDDPMDPFSGNASNRVDNDSQNEPALTAEETKITMENWREHFCEHFSKHKMESIHYEAKLQLTCIELYIYMLVII